MFTEQSFNTGEATLNLAQGPKNGPPLLLLHGFARQWRTYYPILPALQSQWQIHAPDFRGHGGSAPTPGAYRVVDYLEDALACLARIDEPAIVLGHSLGSMVAAALAAAAPDKVRAVILEDPPLQAMGERISQTILLDFFQKYQPFAGDERSPSAIGRDLAEMILTDPQTGNQIRLGDTRDAASLRFSASCLKRLDPDTFPVIVEGRWLDDYNIDDIFRGIQCPILLIQADVAAGGMLNDEDVAHIKPLCHDLTHIKLDGVGHMVHWTNTQEFTNFVLGFLVSIS